MKKTGDILKKAREDKGLTLHEIGLSLKINSKVLKAIEEGDEAHLPAKTFLRGFILSYANFLHLNTEEVLQSFYEEYGSTKPKPYIRPQTGEKPPTPDVESPNKEATIQKPEASISSVHKETPALGKSEGLQSLQENKNTKSIAIFVIGLVLVGLITFTKKMIDKYSKEADVPSNEVAQTIEGVTPVFTDGNIGEIASTPLMPEVTAGVNVNATAVATPAATPVATPTTQPTPTPTPVAVATPAPTPKVAPTPAATPAATPTPEASPKPETTGKPVELIVEALDGVEIEYSAPNGKPQKIRLSAEQVHTFKSRSGLKISFSNGGAVNLILNGKDVGIPGDLGKPIKLSY